MLKPEYLDILSSMANLAATFWNKGRWDTAEVLFIQVMETYKRLLRPEHLSMLISIANLAAIYGNKGRWD